MDLEMLGPDQSATRRLVKLTRAATLSRCFFTWSFSTTKKIKHLAHSPEWVSCFSDTVSERGNGGWLR
jgi:hypothetical protein